MTSREDGADTQAVLDHSELVRIGAVDIEKAENDHARNDEGTPAHTGEYFVLQGLTNQTLGPFSEEAVRELIREGQVSVRDCVSVMGDKAWTPLLQSRFSDTLVNQVRVGRLLATTCPRCGSAMVGVVKKSGFGLALILIGIALTPVLVGIPIFVVGMIVRHGGSGQTYLSCPYCHYSSLSQPPVPPSG